MALADRLPQRKKLPHEIPGWVADGARYFITVNLRVRGRADLRKRWVAQALMDSLSVYEAGGRWFPHLLVIMPDHVHLIASFSREEGVSRVIADWKRYIARRHGIEWQSGFFEHRLRTDREFEEKADYMRQNPTRQGLISAEEKWPYTWDRTLR